MAKAEAALRSARAFYYVAFEAAWEVAARGEEVSIDLRRDLKLATNNAVESSVRSRWDVRPCGRHLGV
ncbi:MAG: hypothetical protein QF921_15560 [Pseudomonadales bacterium]|nr:hypothetical protein [Pseudomonadales bacterium]MDP6472788.1 hypothetical protein [Pseudomonadales bacterium]MDP6828001.1 hypothetical protein [Pseudomonadales bacterium]MDP6972900.1 hypothetical protein [Pseudomonadales bacterium]